MTENLDLLDLLEEVAAACQQLGARRVTFAMGTDFIIFTRWWGHVYSSVDLKTQVFAVEGIDVISQFIMESTEKARRKAVAEERIPPT